MSTALTSAPRLEPSAAALRTRCRNPRCLCALPVPADDRRAFCCRGCHRYFYKTRCKVCDRPSQNGRLCSGKCQYAYGQNRNLYAYQNLQMADCHQNRSGDSINPYKRAP
jgi:hypothetical protein